MALRLAHTITAFALMLTAIVGSVAFTSSSASAKDLDCADFSSQAAAQANLNANPSDPNGLDSEGDGLACESNPCPCSTSTSNNDDNDNSPTPKPQPKPKPQEKAVLKVVRVLKGDVVAVRLGNARPYNVHLLGAVVPSSSCQAKASKRSLKSFLEPGNVVRALVSKKAPDRDKLGVLRFLIREKGNVNVGLTQVGAGYAKADKTINYDFKAKYIRVGKKAKAVALGYYATC